LGVASVIQKKIKDLGLEEALNGVRVIEPAQDPRLEEYSQALYEKRLRKGVTRDLAAKLMRERNYFGAMMVERGDADALLSGVTKSYPETIRPALHVIGAKMRSKLAGIYMLVKKNQVYWFADTTVNIDPTGEELADIAIQTADLAKTFMASGEPKVALLSFSNFGSNEHPNALKVRRALDVIKRLRPELIVDGEMQLDTAIVPELSQENFPFNKVAGDANVLIFPDLQSGNIAYKLMWRMGGAEAIGPILVGMNKPVHVLQRGCDVNDIVNMAAICAMDVQAKIKEKVKTV
jgi:malate dehydrogenase (oxaloacetate-decarboxylating)(NADP+)